MARAFASLAFGASLALVLAGSAAGASETGRSQGDARLSDFYLAPDPPVRQPGSLIRREELPAHLALSSAGASRRILYSSTDGVGGRDPIAVSGALFLPKGTPPDGGWPLLAWAHGTVGVADACAPSWAGRSARDIAYLNRWLDEGFAVVATDYQGLGVAGPHPYLLARPAAYGILDSIRAVAHLPEIARDKVIAIGQSQGGAAAFAAAAYAPAYAPELGLRGVVATGVPYLTRRTGPSAAQPDLDKVDPTIAYTFYLGIMAETVMSPRPELSSLFGEAAMPLLEMARTTCVGSLFRAVAGAGLTRRKAVKPGFADALGALEPLFAFPTLRLPVPVFVGTGGADTDVRPENQLALVRESCAAGTTVEAHLYAGLDHGGAVNPSVRHSLPFVRKALAGEPIQSRCEPQPE